MVARGRPSVQGFCETDQDALRAPHIAEPVDALVVDDGAADELAAVLIHPLEHVVDVDVPRERLPPAVEAKPAASSMAETAWATLS